MCLHRVTWKSRDKRVYIGAWLLRSRLVRAEGSRGAGHAHLGFSKPIYWQILLRPLIHLSWGHAILCCVLKKCFWISSSNAPVKINEHQVVASMFMGLMVFFFNTLSPLIHKCMICCYKEKAVEIDHLKIKCLWYLTCEKSLKKNRKLKTLAGLA